MAEFVVSDVDTIRLIRPQAAIERGATAVTAFIGRALKGPINQPVSLHCFEDYQRIFGGLWQPSTLSYAIEQYFECGGRECIVVRVCNGGRAPTLTLPSGSGGVTLIGQCPGTREYLRAAVDYDGIAEDDRFNLVVQRVRAPGSEFVEDQEIFRRVSIRARADNSLLDALAQSRLVRLVGALPATRPERTAGTGTVTAGYVSCSADGDDGDVLSAYDVIGDARAGTGVFALRQAEAFNFLCIPPLSRDHDVTLPLWLVALRLCRERAAMLLLDPPSTWSDASAALEALHAWPLQSEDAFMFYPRVLAPDRLRGRYETFASAPIAAGLMARADELCPPWSAAEPGELVLRASLRAAAMLTDLDRQRLAQVGVNALQPRPMDGRRQPLVTLVPEGRGRSDGRALAARRFALFVANSLERGTRWVSFESPGAALWSRVSAQATAFFESLEDDGAFVGRNAAENYFLICDQRLNGVDGRLRLLFGIAIARPGEFQTFLVTHGPEGSSVRPVSVNRFALAHD